ncbi:hypothetical protein MTR67_031634 [Solanum verrucosum]|uniref:Gag-pol polyprotein n=1 Tax=Solanum verrucosum TaxID=315347 RepID=A0AAF0U2W4_SOLVR|nr:hypothetical protein MTR67_031634 [Solanum verrucosum]
MGRLFPRELIEAKVSEFLTLKPESMSVHEYSLKLIQLSHYAPEIVADIRSRMSLFVAGLFRLSSKEEKAVMLIGDMDIVRLMIHVHQQKGPAPSSASAPIPRNRGEFNTQNFKERPVQSQDPLSGSSKARPWRASRTVKPLMGRGSGREKGPTTQS